MQQASETHTCTDRDRPDKKGDGTFGRKKPAPPATLATSPFFPVGAMAAD